MIIDHTWLCWDLLVLLNLFGFSSPSLLLGWPQNVIATKCQKISLSFLDGTGISVSFREMQQKQQNQWTKNLVLKMYLSTVLAGKIPVFRIRKFLASRIRILPLSSKNSKKTLDLYCTVLWLLYDFLSVKHDVPVNLPSKSNQRKKKYSLLASWMSQRAGSEAWSISHTDPRMRIYTKMSRIWNTEKFLLWIDNQTNDFFCTIPFRKRLQNNIITIYAPMI